MIDISIIIPNDRYKYKYYNSKWNYDILLKYSTRPII